METARNILVVDDEPLVTKSCLRALTPKGYEVTTTLSGRDGLERALRERFDLVVTDLKMPDLDGMELIRELHRERPELAMLVITGYGTVSSAIEATKMGVLEFIEKPFTPEEIGAAVERAFEYLSKVDKPKPVRINVELVKRVLRDIHAQPALSSALLQNGSQALSGYALGAMEKAAIVAGDLVWIEKEAGPLSERERAWLLRRLEAEIW